MCGLTNETDFPRGSAGIGVPGWKGRHLQVNGEGECHVTVYYRGNRSCDERVVDAWGGSRRGGRGAAPNGSPRPASADGGRVVTSSCWDRGVLGRPRVGTGFRALRAQGDTDGAERSECQLCEHLRYNLLFRWFVGLAIDDTAWDHSVFSKNGDRLLAHAVIEAFVTEIMKLLPPLCP